MAVVIPVQGGQIAILDPAGNYYTNIYGQLYSEVASVEIKKWLSRWSNSIPGAKIEAVFSKDMYREFSSTAEFLDWFNGR